MFFNYAVLVGLCVCIRVLLLCLISLFQDDDESEEEEEENHDEDTDDDEDDDNEEDEDEVPRVSTTESAREHVFPILISELVKESILDTFQGKYLHL
jgi:ABC-type Zn2+ transport system substrate-binding protein/surface adhesin